MTSATFLTARGRIEGFEVKGHSGLAPAGSDLLCAAVTSAVRLTECAVNDVLGLKAAVKINEKRAELSLKLPGGLGQTAESACQALLTALMLYLTELRDEYPDHITVTDREV